MQIKTKSLKHIESILFIFIWLVFIISPIVVSGINDTFHWKHVFNVWFRLSPFAIISVINHFVLIPRLFYSHRLWYFVAAIVLLLFLGTSLTVYRIIVPTNFVNAETFPEGRKVRRDPPPILHFGKEPPRPSVRVNKPLLAILPLINSLFIGILILGFDLGLRTSFKWSESEQERTQLEKEKVKSELAFLRNQVSPHFFMNTLNNIHALIDIDAEEAKESIIQLSKLMRHLLYDSDLELIPLAKEVQFIQSYVDLMKLRFTEKVKVNFTVDSKLDGVNVPPLLFTSLIENAFKYGVSYKQESFIHIDLALVENQLCFTIENSKTDAKIEQESAASGIGLDNTKKRLDLLYASTYTMNVMDTDRTFTVQLKLPV